jgi:hypothetical protein
VTIRSTSRTVTFRSPFALKPIEGILPAGDYEVETDEEKQEGVFSTAFVRVATLFTVARSGTSRAYTVKAADLDAALVRDGQDPLPR